MSRYAAMFERLAARGEGAFGAFLMLGDPDRERCAEQLDAVVAAGADMVEVGIPFSDPVADGPVIQTAAKRALDAGIKVEDCFALIAGFRERHPDVPLGILTYANLVMARGREQFFQRAVAAGADSLLVADLPAREARPWATEMAQCGIEPVLIAASNSPPEVIATIAKLSAGYTYCVARAGITGLHGDVRFDAHLVDALRQAAAPPPVFGFGIAEPRHVEAAMAAGAAGVISGSAIVSAIAAGKDVSALVAGLKNATRNDSARR
jgi:tryptophan synthase alpha chain